MNTMRENRNRKLFLLALAVMSLLLAGSTRKPETPAENPLKDLSAVTAEEFSAELRSGFRTLAKESPAELLQYCVPR